MSAYSDWANDVHAEALGTPHRIGAYEGEGWDYTRGERSGMPADQTPSREEQEAAGSVAAAVAARQAAES
jgi:hypothetical protein